ncbi:MAG: YdeI/OmpD-associated family protein [Flavobacteriales bacterium]
MPRKSKDTEQEYRFTATIDRPVSKGWFATIDFPHDVERLFGTKGRVRVKGTINGVKVDRALIPTKAGVHVIVMSSALRKAVKAGFGEVVEVVLHRNPDQDEVIIPEALQETLDFLPEMRTAWNTLTPGMQRGMCHWVGSAKTDATRAKRVAELLRRLEAGEFRRPSATRKNARKP